MKTWRKDRWKGIATSDYDRQRQRVRQSDGSIDRKNEKCRNRKKDIWREKYRER